MRRSALFTVLAVTVGLLFAGAPAASATADTVVTLPLNAYRDLAVDAAHGHVFVTGGGSSGVVVLDLDGAPVTTILDQPGAGAMALSVDGSTLYVALSMADAISAIDTTTLTETNRYATGTNTCPGTLALTGSVIWFGYNCSTQWGGNIGYLDLSGQSPAVTLGRITGNAPGSLGYGPPHLRVTPDGQRLLAASYGVSPGTLNSLVVGADRTLTWGAQRTLDGPLNDFALTADGTRVVTASAGPYYHPRFRTDTLGTDGVFGNQLPYPNAVAITGDIVAAGTNASSDLDVRVYRADGLLLKSYELGENLDAAGLTFAPDGNTLYAVTTATYNSPRHLHVLHDPTKLPTALGLAAPVSAVVGSQHTLTGSLTGAPTGSAVQVTRSGADGTVFLPDVTTGSNGAFTVSDTVPKRGTYTYAASYAGDTTHAPATHSVTFAVRGLVPDLRIATNATTYKYKATATVTAHLGPTQSNRTVRITATPYNLSESDLVESAVDGGSGNLAATYVMTRRTTVKAYFAGDDMYEPRTVSTYATTGVSLVAGLSGYYTTSGSYRVYHKARSAILNTTVAPNRAATCMSFTAQRYYSGTWHTIASKSCVRLSTGSHASFTVPSTTNVVGSPYRVRATFAGDTYNAQTIGAWVAYKFTA